MHPFQNAGKNKAFWLSIGSKHTRLRFKHLRLVEVLHRTGGLAHAADELGVTQSAATKILQDVEQIFGAEIFSRSPRGLVATPAGQQIVEYASRFINDTTRVAADVEAMTSGGAGSLSVGTIMGGVPHILCPALAELRARKPLLTINLVATTSDEIILMLRQRRLEIALCRVPHVSQEIFFDFELLFSEIMWIFVARGHPLASVPQISLADLISLPWVVQPWSSPSRQILESALAKARLPTPPSRVETTSRLAALNLVTHAGMVGFLPSTILEEGVRDGRLVRLNVDLPDQLPGFGLVTRRGEQSSQPATEFAAIVRRMQRRLN